jgi:hypothetical protein
MRTKKHYENLLGQNPSTSIGFTLAADMVYAARHDVIHRAAAHGGEEWKNIARMLTAKYGENLTVDQIRHEMTPIKTQLNLSRPLRGALLIYRLFLDLIFPGELDAGDTARKCKSIC